MKNLAILGSTGSIGQNALKVVRHLPDSFRVKALAAHSNLELLAEQIHQFNPEIVAIYEENSAQELQSRFPNLTVVAGREGLEEVASYPTVDFVVMAIVGTAALSPTVAAIEAKKTIGLASKEVLVTAGEWITSLAQEYGVSLLPIDSEHSALFQCLEGRKTIDVQRVILTASGGPFYGRTREFLEKVSKKEALKHPNWSMGPKVTIDSSTLVNKGLEMIEARWLFNLPPEKIEVVVHPQSIVHSFVEFVDGTLLAQMHEPHMIYPIQYAMTYPERAPGFFPRFDFLKHPKLEFFPADTKTFSALALASEVMHQGGSAPCYFNAANEVLVDRFLKEEISWLGITERLEKLLSKHVIEYPKSLEPILAIDEQARKEALTL